MTRVLASDSAPSPELGDGFGRRVRAIDPDMGDEVEILELAPELVEHTGFVTALGEKVARVSSVRHASYVHLRRLDRPAEDKLSLVSDFAPGWRLSELLKHAPSIDVPIDTTVVIAILRQLLPAVALFSRHNRESAIAALAPERLIISPQARLIIPEHAFGPALEKLNLGREKLWRDYRVAMPPSAGLPRANARADANAVGVIALSLLVGRILSADEFPGMVQALLGNTTERRDGDEKPLSSSLLQWMTRALQFDVRTSFQSPSEMQVAFESVLASDRGYVTSPKALEKWVTQVGGAIDALNAPPPPPEPEPEPPPPIVVAAPPPPEPAPEPETEPEPAPESAPARDAWSDLQRELAEAGPTPASEPEPVVIETAASFAQRREPEPEPEWVPVAIPEPEPEPAAIAPEPEVEEVAIAPEPEPMAPTPVQDPDYDPIAAMIAAFKAPVVEPPPAPEPVREPEPAPEPVPEPVPEPAPEPEPEPEPEPVRDPEPEPEPERITAREPEPPAWAPPPPPEPVWSPPPPPEPVWTPPPPPEPAAWTPPPVVVAPVIVAPVIQEAAATPVEEAVAYEAPAPVYEAPAPEAPTLAPLAPSAPLAPEEEAPVPVAARRNPILYGLIGLIALLAVVVVFLLMRPSSDALSSSEGELVVTSRPSGARVSIDSKPQGNTPVTFRVSAGAHVLEVQSGKSEPRVIPLTIRGGVQTSQYIEFQNVAITGSLEIKSEPAGARITVDGQPKGTTPTTVKDIPAGDHEVVVELSGRKVRQVVKIDAGSTASLNVPIPRK